ncbi:MULTISPECIES: DUF637 domain-containing protein [Acinetobacter]|uniref:two-partner secretion domain-containing protein n=1 Tax=Acinetobacter TaxID=469 RepID=UPI00141AC216|nr:MULTISPECIES: DUF637 domain-containing protein [Acinetobacter]MCS4300150.1 filamentous hemagglutinin [Acinetobacter guillouiae]MCW2251304.1 filamentous hemagglutinin [Acinetobacter sp. BIGb0204]NII36198.1 filamentous hemagglutinin [Acinetobacter sp. BIGb0196]
MNKNRYRIIFSKAKNMFIAVAENIRSQTKATGQSTQSNPITESENTQDLKSFHQLWQVKSIVASMSLFMAFSPVYAQMQADPKAQAAQRASIGVGKNQQGQNVPVVNIQTPKNGVSHNVYNQFDVLQPGVVLNNSRNGAGSVIVGQVGANPYLQTGEARVILNEVNSSVASQFKGNLEVAGQRADVIIANPSGINIQGGGFINANKAIFTTGKPQLNADGSIKQFVVNQGKVSVSSTGNNLGLGGNNNNADYVDIYAKAVELNGQVHANQALQVITGSNTIGNDLSIITPNQINSTTPTFALDVKALGGMYANNIYIIGTDKGLGVSNAGTIQSPQSLVITSAGKIENTGTMKNTNPQNSLLSISTGDGADIVSSGAMLSNGNIFLESGQNITLDKARLEKIGADNQSILSVSAKGDVNLQNSTNVQNFSKTENLYIDASNINLGNAVNLGVNGSIFLDAKQNLKAVSVKNISATHDINLSAGDLLTLNNTPVWANSGNINLATSKAGSNLSLNSSRLNAEKDVNIYGEGTVSINNLGLDKVGESTKTKNFNVNAQGNLTWQNAGTTLPTFTGKLDLRSNGKLDISGSQFITKDGINLLGRELAVNRMLKSDQNISLTASENDLNLNTGTAIFSTSGDINVTALKGNLYGSSLNLNAKAGKLSMLSNNNLIINADQIIDADDGEASTNRSSLIGVKGVSIGSFGKGQVNIKSSSISSNDGDMQITGNKGIILDANIDKVIRGNNKLFDTVIANKLNAKNIKIESKDFFVEVEGTELTAKQNIEISARSSLSLADLTANSGQHAALSSDHSIYINSIPTKDDGLTIRTAPVTFNADGLFTMVSEGEQRLNNLNVNAGAILIESKDDTQDVRQNIVLNARGSEALAKNDKLKNLNGNLTIQTYGQLYIDPKIYTLKSTGDINLDSKRGKLTLAGYTDNVVNLTTQNGLIRLQGDSVELRASMINAGKGVEIAARNGDITLSAIKRAITDSNFKPADFSTRYGNAINDFQIFKEKNPEYKRRLNQYTSSIQNDRMFLAMPDQTDKRINGHLNSIDEAEKGIIALNLEYGATNFYNRATLLQPEYGTLTSKKRNYTAWNNNQPYVKTDDYSSIPLSGYMHQTTDIKSAGDISLLAASGLMLNSTDISAGGNVNLYSKGNLSRSKTSDKPTDQFDAAIVLASVKDQYVLGQESNNYFQKIDINKLNKINGRNINIITEGKLGLNTVLQGVDLSAVDGIKLLSTGSIDLLHSVDNLYTKTQERATKESLWGLKKSTRTTTKTLEGSIGKGAVLKAKKIDIEALGGNLALYGTQIIAPKDTVKLRSSGDIRLLAFRDQVNETEIVKKDAGFLGIEYRDSNSVGSKIKTAQIPTEITGNYVASSSAGSTYLQGTRFNFTEGISLKVGDGTTPSPDAKLVITAANGTYSRNQDTSSKSALWQSMGSAGTTEDFANLPKFNGPTDKIYIKGSLAIQVPIKNGDKREIIDVVNELSNKPGYEYLKSLVENKNNDIDWSTLALANKNWDYKSQGLTPAGAALVVIIVTALTSGAGSSLVGALGGSTTTTVGATTAAMSQAAITSLSTQVSISLINNGGNIDATLKELGSSQYVRNLVTSIATAGILASLASTELMRDLSNNSKTGNFITDITARTSQGIINAGASTLVDLGINGGSLSEKLAAALLTNTGTALQGSLSIQIKGLEDSNYLLHKIAHAAAGCAAAAVGKASCEAGALGAAVGEVVAEQMDKSIDQQNFTSVDEIDKYTDKVREVSKLVAGSLAALTGYDVNTATSSADIAIRNNRQFTLKEVEKLKLLAKGDNNKEAKLAIAACAMIQCARGYEGTTEYAFLKAMQDAGASNAYASERNLLKGQNVREYIGPTEATFKLFEYSSFDSSLDTVSTLFNPLDRQYKITDRVAGGLMVVGGVAGGGGSALLGSTCATGVGCALAFGGLVYSADLTVAGISQIYNGKPTATLGAQAISLTSGLNLTQSQLVYDLLGFATITTNIKNGAKLAVQEQRVLVNKPVASSCTNGITCFVAGTLIETDQGLKPIDEFMGGELVWARSDNDFSYGYKPVVATKVTNNQPIYEVIIKNDLGQIEKLLTTEEHPFWLKNKGWRKASILEAGDILFDRNNQDLVVISQSLLAQVDTVYNIQVDDFHTYHVGKLGVWVHNSQCCELAYQLVTENSKRGVYSNTKLKNNAIDIDLSVNGKQQLKTIVQKGDVYGDKTEALFNTTVKEQGGSILSGGKYGSNNGFDHVVVFKDTQGNTTMTMLVDSKQQNSRGISLIEKAAGGQMQMSEAWIARVMLKLDKNSETYKAVTQAVKDGTLVKGIAYVDKAKEKLMMIRIDPVKK